MAFARLRSTWAAMATAEQTARLQSVAERGVPLDRDTRAFLVGRYDAEIRHADAGLAQLFAALRARGANDANTLVVVTADHGEEFLDHGGMLHSHTLLDELLRVPLVVRGPGVPAGVRVAEQVRGIDVAPTLLEAAQLPTRDLDGQSLAPLWGGDPRHGRPAVSSREGKYLAYRADGTKLVVASAPYPGIAPPDAGIAGLRWMARVALDRAERPKVGFWSIRDEPREPHRTRRSDEMGRAYAALDEIRRREPPRAVPFDAPVPVDDATALKLRALGYAP